MFLLKIDRIQKTTYSYGSLKKGIVSSTLDIVEAKKTSVTKKIINISR